MKVIVFGTGGNCLDFVDIIDDINRDAGHTVFECVGFLDDNQDNWGKRFFGVEVLGGLADASKFDDCHFINGVGSYRNFWKRDKIIAKAGLSLEQFVTIVHPTASVSRRSTLGRGVVVFPNVTITSNVTVGHHVTILQNASISHDSIIGDYSCITSHVSISGNVTAGEACYFGANAAVRNSITIGKHCLIGMGATVVKDIPDNQVVVGSPAKFFKQTYSE